MSRGNTPTNRPNRNSVPDYSGLRAQARDGAPLFSERVIKSVDYVKIDDVHGYRGNARTHSKRQLDLLQRNIEANGFVIPIIIDDEGTIIAGHARVFAAKKLGMSHVPAIRLTHLSPAQVRAFRIAENKLASLAEWDHEALAVEFQGLVELSFDLSLTGFEMPEIDHTIETHAASVGMVPENLIEGAAPGLPTTRLGDLYVLDEHRVLCADARARVSYQVLLRDRVVQLMWTDPPWNVAISGHVGCNGKIQHPEFVMASGEMSDEEFEQFLRDFIRNATEFSADGSVHYIAIDWRHVDVVMKTAKEHYGLHLNTAIWVKSAPGLGSFLRSQHEMITIFKVGNGPQLNHVQMGRLRNRSNVWRYEGANSINPARRAELALHPTTKPVEMIAECLRDASNRGGIILDPFAGAGSTLIACEVTGRVCRTMELDPRYVDVVVRRWQKFTGRRAVHADTGLTFDELTRARSETPLLLPPTLDHEGGA